MIKFCKTGWPKVNESIRPYWQVGGVLTLHKDKLLLYNTHVVVPASLQSQTLSKLHQGHQGIDRCRQRARISVWWPGISSQIEDWVKNCLHCAECNRPRKEPLRPSELPAYPWQKVGTDLFLLNGATYIVIVDYFSRYPEVIKLASTTSQSVIAALKSTSVRHGILEIVVSDNGPQYCSQEFTEFAKAYSFSHITNSSPHYPQSNGHVERAVKTVKKLLTDSGDHNLSLLACRTTLLPWCGYSPAELLMGRTICSNLPQPQEKFTLKWPYLADFRAQNQMFKQKQKRDFDRRHKVKELPSLPDDTKVFVTTDGHPTSGRVVEPANAPRSHIVQTQTGLLRRNRSQLNVMLTPERNNIQPTTQNRAPIQTCSRIGTLIVPPVRLS